MLQTLKEMLLFSLLQQGECSLRRNISKKGKGPGASYRQVNKGVIPNLIGALRKDEDRSISEYLRVGPLRFHQKDGGWVVKTLKGRGFLKHGCFPQVKFSLVTNITLAPLF